MFDHDGDGGRAPQWLTTRVKSAGDRYDALFGRIARRLGTRLRLLVQRASLRGELLAQLRLVDPFVVVVGVDLDGDPRAGRLGCPASGPCPRHRDAIAGCDTRVGALVPGAVEVDVA